MSKSLSERIAERAKARKTPGKGGKNRAAFLALRNDIASALADGWSVRVVWETLKAEGKIDFSYDPFTKYVNSLIVETHKASGSAEATPAQRSPSTSPTVEERMAAKPEKQAALGFNFDSKPNKKDLV